MKVAIYARVSTDDKGQDPLNQLLELREFASRQGWTVVREYTDEATAKNGERTGLKEMWADVAKHRFDLLLFWSLDRLTREGTYKTLTYLRRLTDSGVKFKSYTEQYIDSLGAFSDAIIGATIFYDPLRSCRPPCLSPKRGRSGRPPTKERKTS
jgi:DNA invertase Pin-like site-specific DNA recombinase